MTSFVRRVAVAVSALSILSIALACVPGPSLPPPMYHVTQSSVAPVPKMPLEHAFEGAADFTAEGVALTSTSDPSATPTDRTLSVAPGSFGTSVGLHIADWVSIRPYFTGDVGNAQTPVNAGQPVPGSHAWGGGLAVALRFRTGDRHWNLDLRGDLGWSTFPTIVSVSCVANCYGGTMAPTLTPGDPVLAMWGVGASVGYSPRPWGRISASIAAINHPDVRSGYTSTVVDGDLTDNSRVIGLAGVTIEARPVPWLMFFLSMYGPFVNSPITYGPLFDFGVRLVVGTHAMVHRESRTASPPLRPREEPPLQTLPPTNPGEQELPPIRILDSQTTPANDPAPSGNQSATPPSPPM